MCSTCGLQNWRLIKDENENKVLFDLRAAEIVKEALENAGSVDNQIQRPPGARDPLDDNKRGDPPH